jgi:hypothetical protein
MSRSRRKFPACGITCCESEKDDKRLANRILRAKSSQTLRKCPDYDALVMPVMDDAMNVWAMGKDGRQHFDPKKHPDLMRK